MFFGIGFDFGMCPYDFGQATKTILIEFDLGLVFLDLKSYHDRSFFMIEKRDEQEKEND